MRKAFQAIIAFGMFSGTVGGPLRAADIATIGGCSIVDAAKGKQTPAELYVVCGGKAYLLGAATSYVSSTNAKLASAVVVLQTNAGTSIRMITIDNQGKPSISVLDREVANLGGLSLSGANRNLAVDLSGFPTNGIIRAGIAGGTATTNVLGATAVGGSALNLSPIANAILRPRGS